MLAFLSEILQSPFAVAHVYKLLYNCSKLDTAIKFYQVDKLM